MFRFQRQTVLWVALVGAASFGVRAAADVVHFVNPPRGEQGHWNWHWQEWGEEPSPENWLDITLPSTEQGGGVNGNSVGQFFNGDFNDRFSVTSGGALVVRRPGYILT